MFISHYISVHCCWCTVQFGTCESLDVINSTTAQSVVDAQSESVTDNSQPVTGSALATKHLSKTECAETDPRDIVARIYREELQKLAATAKTNGNFAEYIMYERELERLAQSSTLAGESVAPVSSAPARRQKDSRHSGGTKQRSIPTVVDTNTRLHTVVWPAVVDHPEDLRTRSSEPRELVDNSTSQCDVSASDTADIGNSSALSTDVASVAAVSVTQQDAVVIKSEEMYSQVDDETQALVVKTEDDCSPLDLMRTIADSVTSKPHKKSPSTEAPRYALPPITADQLKRCSYLNTDEVVAAVRSTLADYSISQRLFGEAVLGLSQACYFLLL